MPEGHEQLQGKQVERARYEADLARQRFVQVDPGNRLVAVTLEAEWNERLKLLATAEEEFQRRRDEGLKSLGAEQKSKVMDLASDFSRLWNDPGTPARERKRVVRLLIEDITLQRDDQQVTAHVRFKAGATRTITLRAPRSASELYRTDTEIIQEIDRLLEDHTDHEIAKLFTERGLISSRGRGYTSENISTLRATYKLKSRTRRLRDRGYIATYQLAKKLKVDKKVINRWGRQGLLQAHHCGPKFYLYEDPTVGTNATLDEVRDRLRAASIERSKPTNRERGAV